MLRKLGYSWHWREGKNYSLWRPCGTAFNPGISNNGNNNIIETLPDGITIARIDINKIFTSNPIDIFIPENTPNEMIIQLNISNIYSNYGKSNMVKLDGISTSRQVLLYETDYYAQVTDVSPVNSFGNEDIIISE